MYNVVILWFENNVNCPRAIIIPPMVIAFLCPKYLSEIYPPASGVRYTRDVKFAYIVIADTLSTPSPPLINSVVKYITSNALIP